MPNVLKDMFKDYNERNNIADCIVDNINLFKKSNRMEIYLKSDKQITLDELSSFEKYVKNKFNVASIVCYIKYSIDIMPDIEENWQSIQKYIASKYPAIKGILLNSKINLDGREIKIILNNNNSEFLKSYNFDKIILDLLETLYGKKYKIVYQEEVSEETKQEQIEYLKKLEKDACKRMINNLENVKEQEQIKLQEEQKEEKEEQTDLIFGRNERVKEKTVKVVDLNTDYKRVAIEGKVYPKEPKELKNGKTLAIFHIYDGTSTIPCKAFLEPQKASQVLERINNAKALRVIGNVNYDNYASELRDNSKHDYRNARDANK